MSKKKSDRITTFQADFGDSFNKHSDISAVVYVKPKRRWRKTYIPIQKITTYTEHYTRPPSSKQRPLIIPPDTALLVGDDVPRPRQGRRIPYFSTAVDR